MLVVEVLVKVLLNNYVIRHNFLAKTEIVMSKRGLRRAHNPQAPGFRI
jgi:hypothetical protein